MTRTLTFQEHGTQLAGTTSIEAALEKAGLNWTVDQKPLYARVGDRYAKVKDKVANVRSDNGEIIGVVGRQYKTCDNATSLSFIQDLVDDGGLTLDTAGDMNGGKRVWVSCKLPEKLKLAGEDYETYVLVTNAHDGSRGVTCMVTPVKMQCLNMNGIATSRAQAMWSMHHRSTLDGKLEEAREALALTLDYTREFDAIAAELAKTQLSDEQFKQIIEANFPQQKRQLEKNVESLLAWRQDSETIDNELRMTAWGAFNAVTEHQQHVRTYRTEEARFKHTMFGGGPRIVNNIGSALLELAR